VYGDHDGDVREAVRILSTIAAKCPVHRTLDGDVMFDQQVEIVEPAAT
jgi:uncharacterized OsmC-like protein